MGARRHAQAEHSAVDRVRERRYRHHRRQPRLRTGHGRICDAARHHEGGQGRPRDDRPAQLRPPGPARRLGGDGSGGGAGVAALSQHVGRAARRAVRRQRPAVVDQSDGDRRTPCGRAAGDPRHHDVDGRGRQAHGRAEQRRACPRRLDRRQGRAPDDVTQGFLRRRCAAHDRRAQGLGAVDPDRPARGRRDDRQELGSRRHDPAQQHAVDLYRACGVRRPGRRTGRSASGSSSS